MTTSSLIPTPSANLTSKPTKVDSNYYAILDSGASGNYLTETAPAEDKKPHKDIRVTLPDGTTLQSSHKCKIPNKLLPDKARKAHIIPGMKNHSLLSVSVLCDAGCQVRFGKNECNIIHNNLVVLKVQFSLVVDDFGIKYIGKEHLDHLMQSLREHYDVSLDETGSLYCGITLKWNYEQQYVDISMPGYVQKQLTRYNHPPPSKPQHCPYNPSPIQYGKASQNTLPPDESPALDADGIKYLQQVIGSFLYYARATDTTIPHTLSELASEQSTATENTLKKCKQFLDYMATHPDAAIRYHASDMILNVHSDASYLSAKDSKSRASGYFFMGSLPRDGQPIKLNGAISIICSILKFVASSAAEAELGALFLNAKEARIMRLTLHELGHPQPPTPIHVDNSTTVGIVNNTVKRQKSRSMEMRYFWLLERHVQKEFNFQYQPGQENLADYQSKAHLGSHHVSVRPFYILTPDSPRFLPRAARPSVRRGCVDKSKSPYLRKAPLPTLTRVPRVDRTLPAAAAA